DRNPFFYSYDSPKVYSDPLPFEVVDSDVTNLELKAQRGVTLEGVVVPDGITNKKNLLRLMNLRISASVIPTRNRIRVLAMNFSATIAAGSFQIEGLTPGRVSLFLASSGMDAVNGFSITRIERNGIVQEQGGVELQAGQNAPVRVFVTYGTAII